MKTAFDAYLTVALAIALPSISLAQTTSGSADDALVDALVQEGLLSHAQADRVRDKINAADTETPLNKIALSDSVKSLTFYGDGRLRYENIDQGNHYEAPVVYDRERYRLRFGADYKYSDNFKAGFELESGTTNDSANQTMGSMFTKASINIGKIYLRYDPTDWATFYAGKFTNPLYTTTDMVYSFDENPEGGAEVFNFHPLDNLTVGFTGAQYLYINSNESTTTPNLNKNDVLIVANQIPVTWKITKNLSFKVAPGFTFYTGGGNTNYDGGVPTNSNVGAGTPASLGTVAGSAGGTENLGTAVNYGGNANSAVDPVFYSPHEADDLAIISAPGEFDFLLDGVAMRPYWDFNMNLDGKGRVQDVYLNNTASAPSIGTAGAVKKANSALGDNLAWALGLQVGQNKKKGDWSGLVEFRQIGLGAVDQNINGTDFADSYANQEGFKLSLAYNFTDFLTGTVTYYDTWDYKSGLYKALGGGNAAPTVGSTQYLVSAHTVQRVQVDLGWKF
jgi:hypothetical protein